MSHHSQNSQARLHGLFRGFAEIVGRHIQSTLLAIAADPRRSTDTPIRVLDLGAGSVPYASSFSDVARRLAAEGRANTVQLTLLDKDPDLKHQSIADCAFEWKVLDILPVMQAIRDGRTTQELTGPFDLVILAASLHEFYNDAVEEGCACWDPGTFHRAFLAALCKSGGLLSQHGRVVIADYAWSELADPNHLDQIAEAQRKIADHADPPWSFARPKTIVQAMFDAQFCVESSESRGLFDQLDDREVATMFPELPQVVRETIRLRSGFVLGFERDTTPVRCARNVSQVQSALLHVARSATRLFRASDLPADALREELNRLLTSEYDTGMPAPLVTLVSEIYRDAQEALRRYAIAEPGACEIWFGIALKKFQNGRFIPQLRPWWQKGAGQIEAGVFMNYCTLGTRDLLAGPVAIAYNGVISPRAALAQCSTDRPPAIHNWCVNLHRAIRNSSDSADRRSGLFRSVTIFSPRANARDRAVAAAWGSDDQQRETGHYLIRGCPQATSSASCPGPVLAAHVVSSLDVIARFVAGQSVSWQPTSSLRDSSPDVMDLVLYSAFLSMIFGLSTPERMDSDVLSCLAEYENVLRARGTAASAALEALLAELRMYSAADPPGGVWPRYQSYTTLALGCDGLSDEDPNTVMLFSEHPIPPAALNQIARYTRDLSSPLVQAEYIQLERMGAASRADLETTERLIPAFGHDAKQPASVIAGLLNDPSIPDDIKIKVGTTLAHGLEERLSGFSSIVLPKKADKSEYRADLWMRPTPRANLYPRRLTDIFKEALASALVSICLREKPASFIQFKKHLGINRRLVDVLHRYPSFDAMRECITHFDDPVLVNCDVVWTPEAIQDVGGNYRTYPVYHSLRLIFSEIVNNALKYELNGAIKADPEVHVQFKLLASLSPQDRSLSRIESVPVCANLTLCAIPPAPRPQDWIPETFNGLLSLRSLSSAIGADIPERPICWKHQHRQEPHSGEHVTVPYFTRYDDRIEWTINDVPMFM